jgi:hypothetical protein
MPGEERPTFIAFPSPYISSRNEDNDEDDTDYIAQQLQNPAHSHNNGVIKGESDHERQAGGRSILSPAKLAADHEIRLQIH